MQLAERNRHRADATKDDVLQIPMSVLTLEDRIAEKYDSIKELTVFGVDEESGQPQAKGFSNQGEAEKLQEEIARLNEQKAELVTLIDAIEEIFESYGMTPRSMQALSEEISEIVNAPRAIAFKINGKVRALMDANRGITLAEIWANPEIMALETERGQMITRGEEKVANLVTLKDELLPLCRQARPLVEAVRRPRRDTMNPATVAQMQSIEAGYGEDDGGFLLSEAEEEKELDRMEAATLNTTS